MNFSEEQEEPCNLNCPEKLKEENSKKEKENSQEEKEVEKERETEIQKVLRNEFVCALCFQLLYKPVSLNCTHLFCYECCVKALTYQSKCPICRQPNYCRPRNVHLSIEKTLQLVFPKEYGENRVNPFEVECKTDHIPIFLLQSILPKQTLHLHIFEPRYRLMVQRCLEGNLRFGLQTNNTKFGVEVQIESYEELPDGRSNLKIVGLRRYKILEESNLDNYLFCKVEFVNDESCVNDEDLRSSLSSELTEWISMARTHYRSNLMDASLTALGDVPEDWEEYTFWCAAVINPSVLSYPGISNDVRLQVLTLMDTNERARFLLDRIRTSNAWVRTNWERLSSANY